MQIKQQWRAARGSACVLCKQSESATKTKTTCLARVARAHEPGGLILVAQHAKGKEKANKGNRWLQCLREHVN